MDQTQGPAAPPRNADGPIEKTRGKDDGEVGAPVEPHSDFIFSDCDVGRHVDEVAEYLARLGVIVAAHAVMKSELVSRDYAALLKDKYAAELVSERGAKRGTTGIVASSYEANFSNGLD